MRTVCLAWGSLVWKPGVLPVSGEWRSGGPSLPIEFARVGDHGELATVLTPGAPCVLVRWAHLDLDDVTLARRLLKQREEIDEDRIDGVGTVIVGGAAAALFGAPEILSWASAREGVDAVIWTALPPRFAETEGRIPTSSESADYLCGLRGETRRHAEDYVRRVPQEIRTANREAIELAMSA